MGLTIGVDIGGTKVLGGVVDSAGDVLAQTRRDTPAEDPARTADRIIEVIRELAASHPVDAVGIGAAGWIDATRSIVQFAPNLAWRNEPLREKITAAVGLPVVVENDGNAATWAEFQFGAGRDADNSMVLFTVGTGIGSGIVIHGSLIRGTNGIAAELGHMTMVPGGHPCGCGRLGCLEQYASGNALVRFAKADARERPELAEQLLGLAGGALRADVEVFKDSVRAHAAAPPPAEPMDPDRQRDQILRTFVVDGRLTHLPAAHGKRQVVLEHIAASFEPGIRYPEREVNAVLRAWHDDYAALRRYLVDSDLLSRADGTYWRTGGPVAV